MIRLELSREKTEILVSALESALSDLSYEIANTDLQDYRDMLKRQRDAILEVTAALRVRMSAEKSTV
jgi:hypothetical protein